MIELILIIVGAAIGVSIVVAWVMRQPPYHPPNCPKCNGSGEVIDLNRPAFRDLVPCDYWDEYDADHPLYGEKP